MERIDELLTALDIINKAIINAPKEYQYTYEMIGKKDLETIDYLHQLEINNMTDKEKRKWYKEFKKCRKDRRSLKNEQEELTEIKKLVEVPKLQNSIQTAICNLRRIKENRENPVYKPRAIKDLEIRQGD